MSALCYTNPMITIFITGFVIIVNDIILTIFCEYFLETLTLSRLLLLIKLNLFTQYSANNVRGVSRVMIGMTSETI